VATVRFLFVEPFYGGSHRDFTDGLVAHSRHAYEVLTLPAAEWRKRMRRGAIELADAAKGLEGSFDGVIVTDMLDLPTFLALTRPRFDSTPVLAYFHENQFTYPRIRGTKLNSWFGQVNYATALAAESVAFNSEFHRRDFIAALRTLAQQPNNWLVPQTIDRIEAKSLVLPVGMHFEWLDAIARPDQNATPIILWNHRWEFDKSPDLFVRTLEALAAEGVPFQVIVAGDPGPNPHPALVELPDRLPGRVLHHGFAESREKYGALLHRADIVVSTTRHEFFGISMLEAIYAGCFPLLPNAFTYPDMLPPEFHERCLYNGEDDFIAKLRGLLLSTPRPDERLRQAAGRFAWDRVAPEWDTAMERFVLAGDRP
jgi:glycosyltransferase involved in cell wall biosynthesis